ncbi:MAG: helix-turn-helix transcriptional regulator [Cyanobacteriota bacterium]|nr:helix-turn-helix transcriptional regulator [Cyanobacteriota bacterium]
MELNKKSIANIIQNERRKAGLKQAELAEKIGISEKHLSKIETGKNYPALDTFLRIVDTLNLTLRDFGVYTTTKESSKRILLQKIINNSSEKQIDTYADIIVALQKHL